LQSVYGCDSIATLNLSINPVPNTGINESICQGSTFTFNGQTIGTSGQYTQTLQTVAGCDSTIILNLIVNPILSSLINESICQGEFFSFFGQNLTATGTYSQTLQTSAGCDSIVNLDLIVLPLPPAPNVLSNSPVKCPGDIATLNASSVPNAQFYWSGPQNFSSQDSVINFAVQESSMGDYAVYVVVDGCISGLTSSNVSILNLDDFEDYDFPNVITPNGDGINDSLDIAKHYKTCQEFNLKIFNRWGDVVFEQTINSDFFAGKSSADSDLTDGIYFYKLSYEDKTKTGFIHIVR
jgi:gliding motility-associated-like protein